MATLSNLLCAFILNLWCVIGGFKFYDGLVNTRVQMATYLTSGVTKTLVTVEIKNFGNDIANRYLLSLSKSLEDHLALIEVFDSNKNKLQIEREYNVDNLPLNNDNKNEKNKKKNKNNNNNNPDNNPDDNIYFSVQLPSILQADNGESSQQLKITIAYIHLLNPLPKQIKKTSKQFFTYKGNQYFYSPYKTEKIGTKYSFASDKFKSYTKPVAEIDGKKITYGPFKDLKPFSYSGVYFHFQYHNPYLTITEAVRDIEISHWGNVRIEESFLLQHDGAKLKGAYEVAMYDRYEHIMGQIATTDPASVRSFRATLPLGANNVYYIDRIGNVSTSSFRVEKKKSILDIRPRYPLYGGWKTDFAIGYDVPSVDLISIDTNTNIHTLNISFGIPFRDPVTDLLITRIALPEGAHDVKVICPYDIQMETESKRYTYLDTMVGGGRPLITFHKKNVISLHNKYFQITYVYDKTRIYFKPVLIIIFILTFFITIILLKRISPSLDDNISKKSSNRSTSGTSSGINIIMNLNLKYNNVDYDNIMKKLNDSSKNIDNDEVKKIIKSSKNKLKKLKTKKDENETKSKIMGIIKDLQTQLQ